MGIMRHNLQSIDRDAATEPGDGAADGASSMAQGRRGFDRKRIGRTVGAGLSVALFGLSLFVLARVVARLNLSDLRAAVAATSAEQIVGASLLTALSYLALTGYDALAMRQLRLRVPYRITAFGSFASYAISFMLGFPLITGGTVRYWIYSRAGLSAGKVATITVIAGFTFWTGMAALVAASLIFAAEGLSNIDFLTPALNRTLGLAIAAVIAGYFFWVGQARRRITVQGYKLEMPGVLATLGQMALSITDLCAAAGVLYVLLPPEISVDFPTFIGIYVFACMLGIASHVPGSLGVFEATMIRSIPGASEERIVAALFLYRLIYFVVPFVLALALLGADEIVRRWTALREAMDRGAEEEASEP